VKEVIDVFRLLEIPALIFAALALVLQWRLLCSRDSLLNEVNKDLAENLRLMSVNLATLAELVRGVLYRAGGGK
jgi:hypothetical protein